MIDFGYDALLEKLKMLDEDSSLLFGTDDRYRLVIVGGTALILQRYIEKTTQDIDAISVSPDLLELLAKYDINCHVQAYIHFFPYNYEDRLVLLFQGRKVDFFAASLEDIVISKLYSTRRVDQTDITAAEVLRRLDWNTLEMLALDENEAMASALNDRTYKDFMVQYEAYIRRYRPCEN